MPQINLHVTRDFLRDLRKLMKGRAFRHKSEAIRAAVAEAAARAEKPKFDFDVWIGLGRRAPTNPSPRFHRDDDLWRKG